MIDLDTSELVRKLGLPASTRWMEVVARRGKAVWRIDCRDGTFAARIFRPGEEESAAHEHQMMAEAHKLSLPVSLVRATATVRNRPVLLVDWSPGRVLGEVLRSRPWRALRLGRAFGELQAKLHLSGMRNAQTADWIEFFGPVDESLRHSLCRAQARATLVHFDYHPWNIVHQDGKISGILDWTNARFADPRADLARTWTILALVYRSGRRRPVRRLAERLFENGWWQGYVRIAGPQPQMPLFLAWAVFGLLCVKTREASSPQNRKELTALARLAAVLRTQAGLPRVETNALIEQASAGL
jgi:Ser/Thr protein kinase RdoA (MazF antagonist)